MRIIDGLMCRIKLSLESVSPIIDVQIKSDILNKTMIKNKVKLCLKIEKGKVGSGL